MAWRTTATADEDIAGIESYGAVAYGRARAADYVDDLFAMFELLAASPYIAPQRQEIDAHPRLHRFRSHHIFYIVENEDVLIIRVLHARQDWLNLL